MICNGESNAAAIRVANEPKFLPYVEFSYTAGRTKDSQEASDSLRGYCCCPFG